MSDAMKKLEAIKRLILADLEATSDDELRRELIEDGECPEKIAEGMRVSLETVIQKFQRTAGVSASDSVPVPPSPAPVVQPDSSYPAQPEGQEVTARKAVLRQAREALLAASPHLVNDSPADISVCEAIAAINEALQEPT